MKRLAFLIFLFASPAYAIGMCGSGPRINCIVDGDTFWYQGEKFRMIGYDTPEPRNGICGGEREKRLAKQASARLLQLFNSSQISIQRRGKDEYGRTLATVRADGVDVGEILIREGLARSWPDGCEFWCGPCS